MIYNSTVLLSIPSRFSLCWLAVHFIIIWERERRERPVLNSTFQLEIRYHRYRKCRMFVLRPLGQGICYKTQTIFRDVGDKWRLIALLQPFDPSTTFDNKYFTGPSPSTSTWCDFGAAIDDRIAWYLECTSSFRQTPILAWCFHYRLLPPLCFCRKGQVYTRMAKEDGFVWS